jgi:hypothetical protein
VSYSPSSTYNNFGNGISYNSSTWFSNRQIPAVVQAGLLKTLTGPLSHPALAQVFEQGADDRMFLGRRCRPNWIKAPTAVNVWVMYKMNDGDVFNQAPGAGTMVDGKLDFLVRARWLSPQIYVTAGDFELAGIQLDMDPMGMR